MVAVLVWGTQMRPGPTGAVLKLPRQPFALCCRWGAPSLFYRHVCVYMMLVYKCACLFINHTVCCRWGAPRCTGAPIVM